MNKKIYLIVLLAIIITTLGETVSLISGEHGFYSNQTMQDKCTKCHGDVKVQLSTSVQHSTKSCTFCHAKSATNHTNTVPDCQDCHANLKLNDTLEAHAGFVQLGSEGCIACHTTYNAIVNYSRAEYIEYDITDSNGNWSVSNFTTTGTLNLSYNANRTGGNHNWKNVSCQDCHQDIFDAVSRGGHAVVIDINGNGTQQAPYHNNTNSPLEAWCRTCHNRSDTKFSTQHAARRTTCDECHQAYGVQVHPGDFINTGIKSVPYLYRSLVCIACKSTGWQSPNPKIHFRVHEEPYFDVVVTQ
ncbi:MAG: hypothetical protein O8C62_09445 [Candidatus Methanoperedens sp.]|nr:hypothetical protein [Candidatus Methanoperedens sp.]